MKRVAYVVTFPFFLAIGLGCVWLMGQHIKRAAK